MRWACVPLPAPGGPSRMTARPSPCNTPTAPRSAVTSATQLSLLYKPFIVPHHQLGLDLLDCIHRHADHDQQRGAAKIEIDFQPFQNEAPHMIVKPSSDQRQMLKMNAGHEELRQETNRRQVYPAHKRQPSKYAVDLSRRVAPGTYARDNPAILSHVVRKLGGIEHNPDIEKREQDNQRDVDEHVPGLPPGQIGGQPVKGLEFPAQE